MSTKRVSYEPSVNEACGVRGIYCYGQSFRTIGACKATLVKLQACRISNDSSAVISLRETIDGVPHGGVVHDLCSGILYTAGLVELQSHELVEVSLGVGVVLAEDTLYCIVMTNIYSSQQVGVFDKYPGAYADGAFLKNYSADADGEWIISGAGEDFYFEIWGEDISGAKVLIFANTF